MLCLRVIDCDVIEQIDLPELESIILKDHSFAFNREDETTTLIMRSGASLLS